MNEVRALKAIFKKANVPITFTAANGTTNATEKLQLHICELGKTREPYVLASTPAVLSIGMRCRKYGYTFIWIGDKRPCFIFPGRYALTLLQVELDIPYLNQGTQATNLSEGDVGAIDKTLESVGLCRWYGKLAFDLDVEVHENAAPVIRLSETTAEYMGMSPEDIAKEMGG